MDFPEQNFMKTFPWGNQHQLQGLT